MASINAQLEQAIARMMMGEPAPVAPFVNIAAPGEGGVVPEWEATFYEIPAGFPNPPPARPLRGIHGAKLLLAQCGCTTAMIDALVAQGFKTPEKFQLFRDPSQIDSLVNNLFRIPLIDGGCRIPASVVILLKATVKWVVEQLNYAGGRMLDAYLLAIPTLEAWEQSINKRDGSGSTLVEKPPSLTDEKKWVAWKEAFINYLSNVYGVNGDTPLAYVIREHIVFTDQDVTPLSTARIRGTTHESTNFREDNVAVYSILHQLLLLTDSYVHVAEYEGTKDGKAAFAALCYHYDGPSAVSNRLAWAKSEIAASTYRNENQYSLEKYGNRLANAFRILRQHGQGKSSSEEVDTYLQNINSNNEGVMQAVQMLNLQNDFANDFVKTRAKLQEMVARVWQSSAYKAQNSNSPSGRKVAQVKATPAKAGGRGKGKGGGGNNDSTHEIVRKDGKVFYKEVDVTDCDRRFTNKEFRIIQPILKSYIIPNRPPKESNVSAVQQQKKKSSNGNKFGTNQYD